MSIFDFYKKNFPSPFSEKSIVSIMLSFVNLENQVVSIRFFLFFRSGDNFGNFSDNFGNFYLIVLKWIINSYVKNVTIDAVRHRIGINIYKLKSMLGNFKFLKKSPCVNFVTIHAVSNL